MLSYLKIEFNLIMMKLCNFIIIMFSTINTVDNKFAEFIFVANNETFGTSKVASCQNFI